MKKISVLILYKNSKNALKLSKKFTKILEVIAWLETKKKAWNHNCWKQDFSNSNPKSTIPNPLFSQKAKVHKYNEKTFSFFPFFFPLQTKPWDPRFRWKGTPIILFLVENLVTISTSSKQSFHAWNYLKATSQDFCIKMS